MSSSRHPGFYRRTPADRRQAVTSNIKVDPNAFDASALSIERADAMVENVIGTFGLPLATAVNFTCNQEDVIIPMVVEEPSVVAAVSNMAQLVRRSGGFQTSSDPSVMIGQVQLTNVSSPKKCISLLNLNKKRLLDLALTVHPRLTQRGGGVRGIEFRQLRYDEPGESRVDMVVVHILLDCVDAMGANMINTLVERLSPLIEEISQEKVGLRILSNYATQRLATASCRIPAKLLGGQSMSGEAVVDGIVDAYRFAYADPFRAATHNKGIMNGIDSVAIATGNDWRAIEAGAHAWASRSGQYRSLSKWSKDKNGDLLGSLKIPMQVGTVGGPIANHPQVKANLALMKNPRARQLAEYITMVGLAQNLGALKALVTEGIQKGHMRMHARNVAIMCGASSEEMGPLIEVMCEKNDYSVEGAQEILGTIRSS